VGVQFCTAYINIIHVRLIFSFKWNCHLFRNNESKRKQLLGVCRITLGLFARYMKINSHGLLQ